MTRRRALAIAATLGIIVSVAANGAKLAFTDYQPEADEWAAYALMAALPFAMLALLGWRGRLPWLAALVLTLGAWGHYLIVGIPQLARRGHIDMDLGFAIATSPLWIALLTVIAGLLGGRQRR
jgi:hypothetical protein